MRLATVTQIAARHTVPDCWPCTLLRISLALRWRIALAALLLGVALGGLGAALLIVIERRGLTAQLDAIRAALPEGKQCEFELYLKMPYTRRDHPLVAIVQQAFGWTDAQVDGLFAEAELV